MKKKAAQIILLIFLGMAVVFWEGSAGESKGNKTIKLEEVFSIGTLDDDILFQWIGIAVDKKGNIYATDGLDFSLKKFDPLGRLLLKSGKRGRGPGEFTAPRSIDISGNSVFVSDQYVSGLLEFDKSLRFVKHIPLPVPVGDFKIIGGERIAWVTAGMNWAGSINISDFSGRPLNRMELSENKPGILSASVDFAVDREKNFIVVYTFKDKILKMDSNGKILWEKSLLEIKSLKTKKIGGYVVPSELVYKDVAVDSQSRIYVLGGSFSKNRGRDIMIIDPHGSFQGSMTLPESSHCIYIDGEDFLYARSGDGITITQYRVRHDRFTE